MQAYAACDDPEIRAVVRNGYGDLVAYVERVSGARPARIAEFFAHGNADERHRLDAGSTIRRALGRAAARGLQARTESSLFFRTEVSDGSQTNTSWWTFAITSVALFMVTLDNLVVTTALPVIRDDLHSRLCAASSGRSTPTR